MHGVKPAAPRHGHHVLRLSDPQFEDEMTEQAKSDLTLVGLVAIVDPLRPEIHDVVLTLRGAGIRVFMVSGIENVL